MKEKKFIHNRVLFVSIIVGVFSFFKSIICFLIAVRFFNSTYPDFMDANLFDFCTFLFNEFMCSLIIGYTRQREDKLRNSDQFNLDSFDFNKNYQNFSGLLKGDLERELGNDLNDPLLDKIDKI